MDRDKMLAIVFLSISAVAAVIDLIVIYLYKRSYRRPRTTHSTELPCCAFLAPIRDITETGPMIYFANGQQKLFDREYRFKFKKVGEAWRAYILQMPNLNGRDPSFVITHRLQDGEGTYVCWDTPVASLKDMQTIARVWANHIQEYITTGQKFG